MTSRACQELDFLTLLFLWLNKAPVLWLCTCPVAVGGVTRDIPTLIRILKLHMDFLKLKTGESLFVSVESEASQPDQTTGYESNQMLEKMTPATTCVLAN